MLIGSAVKISMALAAALLLTIQAGNNKLADDTKPEIVPITEEHHHHLVLENEYVRVFHVEVAPHEETKFHQHDMDYVFVTLGDSKVVSERIDGKSVTLELKDGDTRFTKGGFAHKAVNLSDKPFVNVTVELKRGYVPPPVAPPVLETSDQRIEIVPGRDQLPKQSLLVAESDMDFVDLSREPKSSRNLKVGDVVWVRFPDHYEVKKSNGADAKFTFIVFSDVPLKVVGAF